MRAQDSTSAQKVADFVASKNYQENLEKISSLTSIEIQSEYSEILSIITQKKLILAKIEITDIEEALIRRSEITTSYTIRKHRSTHDLDESLGVSGEPENTRHEKYSQGYLVNNLIEILVALRGKKELESYLKSIKVQGAKNYAAQIIKWLNID